MTRRIETIRWRDVDSGQPAPWCLTQQQASARYAAQHEVDVPACQAHAGKWVANLSHQDCTCARVTVRGVLYQAP